MLTDLIPNDDEVADLDRRLKEASPVYHAAPISAAPDKRRQSEIHNSRKLNNPAHADALDSEIPAPIVIHHLEDFNTPAMQKFDERYQNEGEVTPFSAPVPTMTKKPVKPANIELDVHDKQDQHKIGFLRIQYIGKLQGTFFISTSRRWSLHC